MAVESEVFQKLENKVHETLWDQHFTMQWVCIFNVPFYSMHFINNPLNLNRDITPPENIRELCSLHRGSLSSKWHWILP